MSCFSLILLRVTCWKVLIDESYWIEIWTVQGILEPVHYLAATFLNQGRWKGWRRSRVTISCTSFKIFLIGILYFEKLSMKIDNSVNRTV